MNNSFVISRNRNSKTYFLKKGCAYDCPEWSNNLKEAASFLTVDQAQAAVKQMYMRGDFAAKVATLQESIEAAPPAIDVKRPDLTQKPRVANGKIQTKPGRTYDKTHAWGLGDVVYYNGQQQHVVATPKGSQQVGIAARPGAAPEKMVHHTALSKVGSQEDEEVSEGYFSRLATEKAEDALAKSKKTREKNAAAAKDPKAGMKTYKAKPKTVKEDEEIGGGDGAHVAKADFYQPVKVGDQKNLRQFGDKQNVGSATMGKASKSSVKGDGAKVAATKQSDKAFKPKAEKGEKEDHLGESEELTRAKAEIKARSGHAADNLDTDPGVNKEDKGSIEDQLVPNLKGYDDEEMKYDTPAQGKQEQSATMLEPADKVEFPAELKKQLNDKIDEFKKMADFNDGRDDAKASFAMTVHDALVQLLDDLDLGTVEGMKAAQIAMGTFMNPITTHIPSDVLKFIARGGRQPTLKDYFNLRTGRDE